MLKVFSEIKKTIDTARLVLIGNGKIETLVPQMEELGIQDSVQYLGVRQDIPRLLQAGDVFVFPSLYEGFPGAVLEAEASGLPCIISDTITDEVVVTPCTHQMSIESDPRTWAELCIKYYGRNREDLTGMVKKAGYDINDLAFQIEEMYTSLEKRSQNE